MKIKSLNQTFLLYSFVAFSLTSSAIAIVLTLTIGVLWAILIVCISIGLLFYIKNNVYSELELNETSVRIGLVCIIKIGLFFCNYKLAEIDEENVILFKNEKNKVFSLYVSDPENLICVEGMGNKIFLGMWKTQIKIGNKF